ncbi:hypothetical protein IWQ60_009433 [Tieghemiomyces parasiticus]|uniref:Carbohydrate-binding module family 19 domain-containing protein n=1 Tax=Tieghemiomyces parasiticus TaxID=78921 RepID=A0A9W7ZU17_9FUNG|nr:hypothetical protein IWQ60_009433 [Tieghemiomyces parasiticus]
MALLASPVVAHPHKRDTDSTSSPPPSDDTLIAASISVEPLPSPTSEDCLSGTMACGGSYAEGFTVCDWGSPVSFACPTGTKCYPNGSFIICNY